MARRASRSYSDKTVNMNVNSPISNPFTKLSNTQFRNCSSLLDHAVFRHALVRKGLSSNLLCARDNSSVCFAFFKGSSLMPVKLTHLGQLVAWHSNRKAFYSLPSKKSVRRNYCAVLISQYVSYMSGTSHKQRSLDKRKIVKSKNWW